MPYEHQPPKPLLVSVIEARRMLGGMSHNTFWHHAAAGEFEITGTPRKRFVYVRSLEAFIDRQPRAPYSRPPAKAPADEAAR
jgi:hypothetical protein